MSQMASEIDRSIKDKDRNDIVRRVLFLYGHRQHRFLAVQKGYRNESHPVMLANGTTCNLIFYKSETGIFERIRRANAVADFLAEHGFPARRTLDGRITKLQAGERVKYAALYNYLPGATIPWEAYTMAHLKLLGQTMSDMHAALANFPSIDLPKVTDEYLAILAQMQQYFSDSNVVRAIKRKLDLQIAPQKLDWLATVVQASDTLPQQALHMDLVRGNVLFNDQSHITGILDFEKTSAGPVLFDVARTLAFLLVDCKFKTAAQVRKYFLQSGYQKRGSAQLMDATIRTRTGRASLLENLVNLFLLYDFYKFLHHNPYEFLPRNEHFVRTKKLLLNRVQILH
jgi:Ser/Thr protein kinase RdoA (MazF antagonist)